MAGRRITLVTRAAAAAVVVFATAAAAAPGPLVVSHLDTSISIPFGRRSEPDAGKFRQKIAQTITAPKGARKLASVSLALEGDDAHAVLRIYEVGKKPPFGTFLREVVLPVDRAWEEPIEWQTARLRPALTVTPGKQYGLVLRAAERRKLLTASAGSHYPGGEWWCFCPAWNGSADFENASWQSAEELDWPTWDLSFKLRFWRKG